MSEYELGYQRGLEEGGKTYAERMAFLESELDTSIKAEKRRKTITEYWRKRALGLVQETAERADPLDIPESDQAETEWSTLDEYYASTGDVLQP